MGEPKLPRTILILGLISLLMDISSEIIHGLLPVFLVSALGASFMMVGVIEGVGEGTVILFKVLAGPFSDWLGKRKPLVLFGYSLSTLSKPLFALALNANWILGARIMDRVGKGIRESPRDALIADITPSGLRGQAFGLRQSLDNVGAVIGPVLAIMLMYLFNNEYRFVFWMSLIPAILCLVLIVIGVRDKHSDGNKKIEKFNFHVVKKFKTAFWAVAIAGAIFQLAKFSEAFLILRARELGLSSSLVPAVLIVMNVVYALSAYPLGKLSDLKGRGWLLYVGLVILALSDLILAVCTSLTHIFIAVALWGLHLGFTQSTLAALIADTCPEEYRGTAYGIFNLFSAVAIFLASFMAGYLWDHFGSSVTFFTSMGLSIFGLLVFMISRKIWVWS